MTNTELKLIAKALSERIELAEHSYGETYVMGTEEARIEIYDALVEFEESKL